VKKKTINIKPSHEGRLHTVLGVPKGEKIPPNLLDDAMHSKSARVRKMAQFAMNAKSFNHSSKKGG
jgi:hypothetical protein